MENTRDIFSDLDDENVKGCAQVYHVLFHDRKESAINLLQIGGQGKQDEKNHSLLEHWQRRFVNASVTGIDADGNVVSCDGDRTESQKYDPTKLDDVSNFMVKNYREKLDIIIDIGLKGDMDKIQTLRNFYPYLKDGGLYIIQNITSNSKLTECPGLIGCVCNHDPYFFTGLEHHMCVVYKRHTNQCAY
jgi:hypothetical protein